MRIHSSPSKINSKVMANNADGMAPCRINDVLLRASPVTINSPRPPAPINAASVAVPTLITAAVRIPVRIIGMASGISTSLSLCMRVRPIANATFFNGGSTENSPITVLRKMGSSA